MPYRIKKLKEKAPLKKIRNIISDLDQQKQKKGTVFQNKMIDVAYYLFNAFGISTKPGRLMLPKWLDVSEERFNEILSTVTEAKNNRLKINVDGREITQDNAESLIKGVGSGKIDKHEFKKKFNNIVDDMEKILNRPHTRSQENMVKLLLSLKEILKPKDKKNK